MAIAPHDPSFTAGPSAERLQWLDASKGLGIVLVVVGHVWSGTPVGAFLYLFHMPLFFILSGYVFRSTEPLAVATSRARSLLVPYAAYLVALNLPSVGEPLHIGSLLYGGQKLRGWFGVFWFVTVLYLAQVAYAALLRIADRHSRSMVAMMLVLTALGIAAARAEVTTPWNIAVVPVAIVLLWIGSLIASSDFIVWRTGALTGCAAMLGLSLLGVRFQLDMKYLRYGVPGLGLANAVAMSVLLIALVRTFERFTALQSTLARLGAASLTIMFLHQAVHYFAEARGAGKPTQFGAALLLPLMLHRLFEQSSVTRFLFLGKRERPSRSADLIAPGPTV